ncbi:MAG: hypothetical protein LUH05_08345 [Candidatus Gastranaerophilales bacterium]|nr:hypothetical protein [Candidatus Gastranaerophilales bacterium]
MNFELNLSIEELEKRTNKDYLIKKPMLEKDSKEYENLEQGDKEALKHLVKAAEYGNIIYMKQDNELNLPFKIFLEEEIKKGNKQAELTKILFDAQLGIIGIDSESAPVILLKNAKELDGKAFYPSDLSKEEFQNILIQMLKDGGKDEVAKILNQRSIVKREGKKLSAFDYTQEFKEEFNLIADELEKAAKTSSNKDFNEYLILQAKALRENNPMLDAQADKKWASLQDTPLEFTISREQYADLLTGSVIENEELKQLLEQNNITPVSKDSIGIRVGIVNKKGTEDLLKVKNYLPLMAENMPLKEKYEQNISSADDNLQTMVDVDIVSLRGDEGSYRGGITIAQNLPNNDKLSLTIGGGRRNVYHRQVRTNNSQEALERRKKRLDATLNKELHKYYNPEADHWFTIGHENVHSLGPKSGTEALGKYKNIIEENKADMGSLALLDCLKNAGVYTEEEKIQILVTFGANCFLKAKPKISQAHRVRTVMQAYFFIREGAISVNHDGVIDIDINKMIPAARKMLTEIIEVQLSQNFNRGEKFINDYFIWNKDIDAVSQKLKEIDKSLNGMIVTPLADYLITNS